MPETLGQNNEENIKYLTKKLALFAELKSALSISLGHTVIINPQNPPRQYEEICRDLGMDLPASKEQKSAMFNDAWEMVNNLSKEIRSLQQ